MPGVSGVTVVTNARVFYTTRLRAHRAPGIPRALFLARDAVPAQLGRFARRECEAASSPYCNDDMGLHSRLFEIRIRMHDRAVVGRRPNLAAHGSLARSVSAFALLGLRRTASCVAAPREARKGEAWCLAGIEPALLAELDFESSASTNSATGAFGRPPPGRHRKAGGI
jgi:hypothetical protein